MGHVKLHASGRGWIVFGAMAFGFSAHGAIVFQEDFESGVDGDNSWAVLLNDPEAAPDVTAAQSDGNTSGAVPGTFWVGANQGFGATRRGIVDEDHGDFTEVGAGKQAFAFRYTNSGLTTREGVIGALVSGGKYTVTIDVAIDGHNNGTSYNFGLVTFDPDLDLPRNDVRGGGANQTAVLASATGSLNPDVGTSYQTVTFDYTSDGTEAVLGDDVALRIFGSTSHAIVDNVSIDVVSVPEPHSLAILAGALSGWGAFCGRRRFADA